MRTILILFSSLFLVATTRAELQQPLATPAPRVPFRVIFFAYDGDPQKDKPEIMTFQVNTLDLRQPFDFPTLGDRIPKTKLTLTKFTYKSRKTPDGQFKDVSELTLTNIETQETAILILGETHDLAAIAGIRRPSTSK